MPCTCRYTKSPFLYFQKKAERDLTCFLLPAGTLTKEKETRKRESEGRRKRKMAMATLKMLDTKGPFGGTVFSLFENPASHIHTVHT